MIKIAFFDVDGTLLKLGSKVPSFQTVQTLQQLQAKGILLCMATGRGYLSVPHFEGVDFDLWLTFNGSYVRSKDAVISKNPLDADDKHQQRTLYRDKWDRPGLGAVFFLRQREAGDLRAFRQAL